MLYVTEHPVEGLYVRPSREDSWADPTDEERRLVEINRLALKYQREEIYFCDSSLVDDLLKWAGGEFGDRGGEAGGHVADEFDAEKIVNLYPDPDEWGVRQCYEYLSERSSVQNQPDTNPWGMSRAELVEALHGTFDHPDEAAIVAQASDETLRNSLIEDIDGEAIDGIEQWRDCVRENAEPAEVFEWWAVSEWLADLLIEVGECVLKNDYRQWWGRCTTGQAYIMDGVLQKAAVRHIEKTKS